MESCLNFRIKNGDVLRKKTPSRKNGLQKKTEPASTFHNFFGWWSSRRVLKMNFLRGGTVLRVLKMGHPVLRQKAAPYTLAEIKSAETKTLIQNMVATLRDQKGLGLAAPQVGVSKQLLVLELQSHTSDIDSIPLTFAFNPKLEFPLKHDVVHMWESCFSVPGYVGRIQRFANTIMDYTVRLLAFRRFFLDITEWKFG
jgi:peptide deformylase